MVNYLWWYMPGDNPATTYLIFFFDQFKLIRKHYLDCLFCETNGFSLYLVHKYGACNTCQYMFKCIFRANLTLVCRINVRCFLKAHSVSFDDFHLLFQNLSNIGPALGLVKFNISVECLVGLVLIWICAFNQYRWF